MRLNEHNDNFELFLKEATSHFRMRPSEKVWSSIYNNFHPSKKTPSLSALLIFVFSFLLLNHTTTVLHNEPARHAANIVASDPVLSRQIIKVHSIEKTNVIAKNKNSKIIKTPRKIDASSAVALQNYNTYSTNVYTNNTVNDAVLFLKNSDIESRSTISLKQQETENQPSQTVGHHVERLQSKNETGNDLSYQFYATSSVGYVNSYRINNDDDITDEPSLFSENGKYMKLSPELNLEAGGAFLLNITSSLKLKAGMQLNYTNYKLINEDNSILNIDNPAGNTTSQNNISPSRENSLIYVASNNEENKYSSTYQISIPFGTELELAGNHQLKWYAGATIQPSYLVGGLPVSAGNEMKNYFQDGLFRKWNVNTSFETFVSYKLPNGSRINAGPQFRYQLFSTYDNKFLYSERLYNIGLKLGISKNF